jgi:hypothetical protein
MKQIPVCLYEDRKDCFPGVRLLVLSAGKHEPSWLFHGVFRNCEAADREWFENQPNIVLRDDLTCDGAGWNVKPALLIKLLEEGCDPVLWCDSDIILAGPVSGLLVPLDEERIVATEEYVWGRLKGSESRVGGWGVTPGRKLKGTVNSCFMRFQARHLRLLKAWVCCLEKDEYRQAQQLPWNQRPHFFISDQDALTALLASEEFADLEIQLLRNGRDIAQCFEEDGYTALDRLRNLMIGKIPPLIHAQGGKPWQRGSRANFQQLSAYGPVALPYVDDAGVSRDWIKPDDKFCCFLDWITFSNPNMRGCWPAAVRTLKRIYVNLRRIW